MNRQEGFAAGLMIVGVIMLALSAWAMGATALAKKRANDLKTEQAAHAATQAQFEGFRLEVKRLGDEAQAKTEAELKRQVEVNNGLSRKIKALGAANAELNAERVRLLQRPPVRPDGSPLQSTTCPPAGASGPPASEYVPLAEYRELEARAAVDARTIVLWREWATSQGLMH
jgi:type II secretory pathway pseudopilin PulG